MRHEHSMTRAKGALRVELVDCPDEFYALRDDWDNLHARDPQSGVFLSWDWLAEAFRDNLYRWSVLVARDDDGAVVGILPIKYRVHWSGSRGEFQTELSAGGRLLWSEYVGFLCDPAQEERALVAMAERLAQLPWVSLSMRYVDQPQRCEIFSDALAERDFSVRYKDYMINGGTTDNLACPRVALPDTFGEYLGQVISRNRRQQFNRFRRRYLDTGDYAITHTTRDTLEDDLDALLGFWKVKWREQKGARQADRVADNYRAVLTAAQGTGTLFLPVLRQEGAAVGALGHVVDHARGIVHFIVAGRDTAATEPFIGSALHFFSIEWAISQGHTVYDFCHGNEDYKYGYGAADMKVLSFEARRRSLTPDNVFDSICVGEALWRMGKFMSADDKEKALRGCAQMVGVFT